MNKYNRVKATSTASSIDKAGAKYAEKVASATYRIGAAQFALAQDWCVDTCRVLQLKDLTKAEKELAKLTA